MNHKLLARYQVLELTDEAERKVAKAVKDHNRSHGITSIKPIGIRSSETDPSRLRGVPFIGRNVAGAIPHTDPSKLYSDD